MVTLIALFIFIGLYLWYATTGKMAVANPLGIEKWAGVHPGFSRSSSLALWVLALGLGCGRWGIGPGALTVMVILMTLASGIVLLAPLGLLNRKTVPLVLIVSLICETLLF